MGSSYSHEAKLGCSLSMDYPNWPLNVLWRITRIMCWQRRTCTTNYMARPRYETPPAELSHLGSGPCLGIEPQDFVCKLADSTPKIQWLSADLDTSQKELQIPDAQIEQLCLMPRQLPLHVSSDIYIGATLSIPSVNYVGCISREPAPARVGKSPCPRSRHSLLGQENIHGWLESDIPCDW